jgi:sugar lactone lactonase YvrE
MRAWLAFLPLLACGRVGFGTGGTGAGTDGGGVDAMGLGPATRLDLLVGRHDPAGYADGTGLSARFSHPYATVAVGTILYVADSGNGTVRRVDTTTGAVTTVAGGPWSYGDVDGVGSAASFEWITGITYLNGMLYVTDYSAHVIRSVDPSTGEVKLFAGQVDTRGGTDGAALGMATFYTPSGITTDGKDLYVVEFYGERVRRIAMMTGQVSLFAGGTDGSMDGTGPLAQFHYPWAISYSSPLLYVSDLDNNAVRTIDPMTASVVTLVKSSDGGIQSAAAGASSVYWANVGALWNYDEVAKSSSPLSSYTWAYGTMDGNAASALFMDPRSLTVVGNTLYMTDVGNSSIRATDLTTQITTTVAGNLEPTSGPVDGIGAAAHFDLLNGIGTDGKRIWVTDENNYTIRVIDPATASSTLIAGTGKSWGTTDGTGSNALFHRPSGIAYGDDGMLYDVDRDSHRLRRIDPTTYDVVTLGDPASYDGPGDVIYSGGVLYIADEVGQRILVADPATGAVTPLAGQQKVAGNQDGVGIAATFSSPRGLSMCGGVLYVADKENHSIRRVDPATGAVTTWVTGGAPQDGPIATARLGSPRGTTCDADALYVADGGAQAIRRIDFATETMTTIVGTFGRPEDHDDVVALATLNTPLNVRIVNGQLVVLSASSLRVLH